MAPRTSFPVVNELDGFESSILSVLAQMPDEPAMKRSREELRDRLNGKARDIANAMLGQPSGPAEERAAEVLSRWARSGS